MIQMFTRLGRPAQRDIAPPGPVARAGVVAVGRRIGSAVATAIGVAVLLAGGVATRPPATAAASGAALFHTAPPINCDATPWRCGIVLGTWQKIIDPTFSGPGTAPIIGSVCAPDWCMFATRGHGGFDLQLPPGLVARIQHGSAPVVDDMQMIKAMLALDPRKWAPNTITGVQWSFTVSSKYADLLRKAGISPSVFLAWMLSGLPGPTIRSAWHCGIFGCKGDGFDTNYHQPPLPVGERGGLVRRATHAAASAAKTLSHATHTALAAAEYVARDVTGHPKAGRPAPRSRTRSVGGGSAAEASGAGHRGAAVAGVAAVSPTGCPPGEVVLTRPTGRECVPPIMAGVRPGLPGWGWALVSLGGILLLGIGARWVAI